LSTTSSVRGQSKPTAATRVPISCARSSDGSERGTPASNARVAAVAGLLARLDLFPLFEHGRRSADLAAPARAPWQRPSRRREDVRMTPNQLRRDRVDRIGEVESSGLGGDLRVKHALKQNVAEFTGERSQVAAVDIASRAS
jgi:hypothetical protein